ncbi:unnamed protein product [Urochloa humidicola]
MSGFAGQLNLVDSYLNHRHEGLKSRVISYWRKSSSEISVGSKGLVLKEILKMARACRGDEDVMRSYRGQCTLKRHDEDGSLEEQLGWSTRMEFDDAILQWHYATDLILYYMQREHNVDAEPIVKSIRALSNYMMFLFAVHPHLLPGPVRLAPYLEAKEDMIWDDGYLELLYPEIEREEYWRVHQALVRGATIFGKLRRMKGNTTKLLEFLLGVWVEMLCYAAHHCNRDSHAKQLNAGGEFITVVWLMTTASFNLVYCGRRRFEKRRREFFSSRLSSSISFCGLLCICLLCLVLQCCCKDDD